MRRGALALAILAALLLASILLVPRPMPYERAVHLPQGADMPRLLVARAERADARYEPENKSTLLLFECGHFECQTLARIDGDARGLVGRSYVLLRPSARAFATTPYDASFDGSMGRSLPEGIELRVITSSFGTLPFWPLAFATPLLAVALVGSAAFTLGRDPRWPLLAAASGVALAALGLRTLGGDAVMFLFILALVVSVNALASLALFRKRAWPVPFALFAAALDAATWWLWPWFPSGPSL